MKRKTYTSNEMMKRKTYNSNEMMKRNSHLCFHLVLLLLIAGGCMNASAQKHVSGRVVDPLMMPVAGASVALTNNSDSSAVSKCASDSSGRFSIAAKPGLYTMRVSCIGYKGYEAEVNCHDDISIHDIVLTPESREIDGVTVTGKRMTYNSKGYAFNLMNEPLLRDNTLLETLTLLPGLSMKEGNLVAYQQDIVSVFINNKKLRLSMPDILHVLSTYESKNIRTVEVLNSTADPEESSRMGFVLKITTKTADDGGSLSLGFSDQTGNTRENTMEPWFSLQQRTGRWSFYLSPSYTPKSVMKRSEHTTTNYYATGRERKEFSTWTMTSKPKVSGTATIAYDFNANHTLMLSSSGEYDETTHRTATDNSIRENGSTHQTNGVTTRTADKKQASVSLDYNGRMGKLTLISAASYTMRNTIQGNEHLQETGRETLTGTINDDVNYRLTLLRSTAIWDMGGGQSTYLGTSYARWNNKTETTFAQHDAQNITFRFNESKFSAFAQYQMDKNMLSMNVSLELFNDRQNSNISHETHQDEYKNSYTYLIPAATLTLTANKKKSIFFTLRYGRDYTLPGMSQYNSNSYYTSEYSYEKGNTSLKPGISDQLRLQAQIGNWAFYAIGSVASLPVRTYGVDQEGMEFSSYDNDAHSTTVNIGFSTPRIQPCKNWAITANAYYQWDRDSYRQRVSHGNRIGMDFTSTCMLPLDITMAIRGDLMTRYYTLYSRLKNPGQLSVTLNKSWLKGKLTTQAMASYRFRQETLYLTEDMRQQSRYSKPMFDVAVALRYQISWGNRRAMAKRKMGFDSELLRMNN